MSTIQQPITTIPGEFISSWFNEFIHNISVDKLSMETNTASVETQNFYTNAMLGNVEEIVNSVRIQSTQFFITKIVSDYIQELQMFKKLPQKLAFNFSEAKILVWAQIAENDDETEDALILSEAKTNNKYYGNGFYISSTIVDDADCLSIPLHYNEVKINGRLSGAH